MHHFFRNTILGGILPILVVYTFSAQAQKQDFESPFSPKSFPEEFLTGWFGNEVRATASRIFRTSNLGRSGSSALAVQPLSTFTGEIWVKLNPSRLSNPQVEFWARSQKNGTGNRGVEVVISWGERLTEPFTSKAILGEENEFPNENQEFRKFNLPVPENLSKLDEAYLKIEIQQGPGSGTSARWLMDDFELVDWIQDVSPPRIMGLKGYSKNEVQITFNEAVDPVFSLFPVSYQMEDRKAENVTALNDSTVSVRFDNSFVEKKTFSVLLSQIPDLEGNKMKDTTLHFVFNDPTAYTYKSLIINELMPAPRSDQDLPNVEYLEIFNPSEKEFRLEGLVLSNSKTNTSLPAYWIQPGAYVVLASATQSELLSQFGEVIPVNSWPTLLNSGELVSLYSIDSGLLDQVSYSTSSWGGTEFANGGYSLEVTNPFFLCDNSEFLRPSKGPKRGTPGEQNSIFSKETKTVELALESTIFMQPSQLEIVFNQQITSYSKLLQISIIPELTVDSSWISSSGKGLIIKFSKAATPSQNYELRISGLITCLGQSLNGFLGTTIVLPEEAMPGELIINEVLFDPRAGDPKFVELHNLTDRYLSLDGWALANLDETGLPNQVRGFGTKSHYLTPKGFLAISTDSVRLKLSYPESSDGKHLRISSLPSFPAAGGTVCLISEKGRLEDQFSYHPSMHHPLIRNTKGVSLERISGTVSANNPSNWQSASFGEDYATPGKKNSMALSGEFESNLIQIEPEVFDPEGSFGPNFTAIRYELQQPGWVGSFSIYSASGLLVDILATNQVLGTKGLFTWSGTDSSGARVRAGYYVLMAEFFDLAGKVLVIKKTLVVGTKL